MPFVSRYVNAHIPSFFLACCINIFHCFSPSPCRAAQRLASGGSEIAPATANNGTTEMSAHGGFCGAIQRAPPPVPAGLARRMANRENIGLGKVSRKTGSLGSGKRTLQYVILMDGKLLIRTLAGAAAAAATLKQHSFSGVFIVFPEIGLVIGGLGPFFSSTEWKIVCV